MPKLQLYTKVNGPQFLEAPLVRQADCELKDNDSPKNNDSELQNQNNSTLELSLFELQMDSTLKTNGLKPT